MTTSEEMLRVVIALTESSPLGELWQTALQAAGDAHAELVALYLDDERWQRAASLPFTREISRAGTVADFTFERARELLSETVTGLQRQIEQLASESDLSIRFLIVPESDRTKAREIVGQRGNLLIVPSALADHPIHGELLDHGVRIIVVDA